MKVKGQTVAGGGVAALLVWIWDGLVPGYPMPAEVAAAVGVAVVGPIVAYAVAWLPEAPGNRPKNGASDA